MLQGNLLGVCGVEEKLRACMAEGVALLVLPESTYEALDIDQLPPDLQAYARRVLRGVTHMVQVLQLAMEGRYLRAAWRGPRRAAATDAARPTLCCLPILLQLARPCPSSCPFPGP